MLKLLRMYLLYVSQVAASSAGYTVKLLECLRTSELSKLGTALFYGSLIIPQILGRGLRPRYVLHLTNVSRQDALNLRANSPVTNRRNWKTRARDTNVGEGTISFIIHGIRNCTVQIHARTGDLAMGYE